ncbi:YigZ family protein [Humibacillus sp. DSM 29435]|uniref:IMPACT family protein n=1 Tax=Humibacillus sp. DSM 29435 TaxID=1869167 RepID=UPI000871BEEC|nr:YigZ family protein [Humibacillus sp. DSM 29435]OFE14719.1 YigZ family protein [Humibacillus sp. DSM 29435]
MNASDETPGYLTLAASTWAEIEVRRSRFVCTVAPVSSEDAARAAIEGVRGASRDAGHHCTAFVLGSEAATVRTNDDGEPSGTAGAPMLDVLRGHGLTDVVAVVARWFGGTLLGTGGLIRAYADAVTAALDDATLLRREQHESLVVALDHVSGPRLENALHGIRGVRLGDVDYSPTGMRLHLVVAPPSMRAVTASIAEITSGRAVVTPGPVVWVDVPTGD